MTLQTLKSPKYVVVDPQMQMLLKMTNYLVSNIVQQLKETHL